EGEVLEILVRPRRDKAAAMRLLRKLLRRQGFVPTVVVTDKLRSYGAALREIGFSRRHEQRQRANNRAENSHQAVLSTSLPKWRGNIPFHPSYLSWLASCAAALRCCSNNASPLCSKFLTWLFCADGISVVSSAPVTNTW